MVRYRVLRMQTAKKEVRTGFRKNRTETELSMETTWGTVRVMESVLLKAGMQMDAVKEQIRLFAKQSNGRDAPE